MLDSAIKSSSGSSMLGLDMTQEVKMKPPLPPEARRPMSPVRALSPAPLSPTTGVRGIKRDGRKLSRQVSDHPHQRHHSPPAWFHPLKPATPPPPALPTCQVIRSCSSNNQQEMYQVCKCHSKNKIYIL